MRMLRTGVLAAAAALAILAAGAAAAPQRTIKLSIGDAVAVAGTDIACYALNSNHKDGMACILVRNGRPVVRTYGVGLAVDGTAVLNRIKADGSAQRIFKRRLQSAGAARGKVYTARLGDLFGFPIDNRISIGCRVINVTQRNVPSLFRGLKVSCWRATATARLPKTYGVSLSEKFAGVFTFDAHGNAGKDAIVREQP